MSTTRYNRIALMFAIVLMTLVRVANAGTISYSNQFHGPADLQDQVLSVPQFNTGLGTLQSALISINMTMNSHAFATNDGDFRVVWDLYQYDMSFTGTGSLSNLNASTGLAPTRVVGTGAANINNWPSLSQYQRFTASSASQTWVGQGRTPSGTLVNMYDWNYDAPSLHIDQSYNLNANNALIGNGSIDFLLNSDNYTLFGVAGAQSQGVPRSLMSMSTDVVADITITYQFQDNNQIPEPPAYALIAVAAIAARRARRA